jgi:hypothetical protein
MRLLVYTCVFGGFDRVFPPVAPEPQTDYVLISDEPDLSIPGWRTMVVDPAPFRSTRAANRHFKMLGHQLFPGYDASVYVDGNVRILGKTSRLAERFLATAAAFGTYRHPDRNSVMAEVEECCRRGQVSSREAALAELDAYKAEGFPDSGGLMEATIIFKNHHHPALQPAMQLWWELFDRYRSRDQFSLPYVVWRTNLPCWLIDASFRKPNPYFGLYPHWMNGSATPTYAYCAARSHDSMPHRLLLGAWHLKWRLQRLARQALSFHSSPTQPARDPGEDA